MSIHRRIQLSLVIPMLIGLGLGGSLIFSANSSLSLFLLLGLLVSLGVAMVSLLRSIAHPLMALEQSTQGLASGNLDELLSQQWGHGPIGQIGENIHELGINLQEVLLLIWNMSDDDIMMLNEVLTEMPSDTRQELLEKIQDVKAHRLETKELVAQFELFNVALQDQKLIAKKEGA